MTHGQPQGGPLRAGQAPQRQAPASAQTTSPEGAATTQNPRETFWVKEPELAPSVAIAVTLSLEEEAKEAPRRQQVKEEAQLALCLAEEGDPPR